MDQNGCIIRPYITGSAQEYYSTINNIHPSIGVRGNFKSTQNDSNEQDLNYRVTLLNNS